MDTTMLSRANGVGTTSVYNYLSGAIVYISISGTVSAPGTASMSLFNVPTTGSGMFAYTTTFIINQSGVNKGYIRTIGVNNTYSIAEFLGGALPSITASTNTVIQTVTAIMNGATVVKVFTNATTCSGTV